VCVCVRHVYFRAVLLLIFSFDLFPSINNNY